ncbi:hypothetical protein OG203_10000 [Nocardia sp. NBC_01499]|uniref:hypothetical protein n=1 Tax=Nocardia sp. NBC_01499 TaxID=2903597 RepID=UPI00386BA84F
MAYLSVLVARRAGRLPERDMTVALLAFPRRNVPFGVHLAAERDMAAGLFAPSRCHVPLDVHLAAERDMVAGLLVLSRHHVPFGEVCLPSRDMVAVPLAALFRLGNRSGGVLSWKLSWEWGIR